jgi:hypothetical protein
MTINSNIFEGLIINRMFIESDSCIIKLFSLVYIHSFLVLFEIEDLYCRHLGKRLASEAETHIITVVQVPRDGVAKL